MEMMLINKPRCQAVSQCSLLVSLSLLPHKQPKMVDLVPANSLKRLLSTVANPLPPNVSAVIIVVLRKETMDISQRPARTWSALASTYLKSLYDEDAFLEEGQFSLKQFAHVMSTTVPEGEQPYTLQRLVTDLAKHRPRSEWQMLQDALVIV